MSSVFVLVLLLPAVDNLVHVVLGGEPAARLLRSASFLALLPLLPLPPLAVPVLQCGHRALPAVRRPQVDAQAQALVALLLLLQVVLDALLPPLLLPRVLVALLEQVPGVVVQLHVQLVQLLDALDLREGGREADVFISQLAQRPRGRKGGNERR